jgi:subtilisin family serine protease
VSRHRAVRIGVVDSGINPRHPQVGEVSGGIGVRVRDGHVETDDAWEDLIGHGTAVAATIRGHAPKAELYSVRIFRRRLVAHLEALVFAVEWAVTNGIDLLNMSLGWEGIARPAGLAATCVRARNAGVHIIAAAPNQRESAIAVALTFVAPDESLAESEIRIDRDGLNASPWARPRGELPKKMNVRGASLAVANATGVIAARVEQGELSLSAAPLLELLRVAM